MNGEVIDSCYEIIREIGSGAMGGVFEANQTFSDRRVAIKLLNGQGLVHAKDVIARFEREALAAAKLSSAHIVQIIDAGHDPTTSLPYTVMELLRGESVEDVLNRVGTLAPSCAIRIVAQTCRGLEKAHEAGIIHRDVKPANIFMHRGDDHELIVKLLDFGVAKVKMEQATNSGNQSLTRTGSLLGSPMYMAPEQARGLKSIDHRVDIWCVGVVLFKLLSGEAPNAGAQGLGELVLAICGTAPSDVRDGAPWVSEELAAIVARCLSLSPADRYQSAADLRVDLCALLPGGDCRITSDMLVGHEDDAAGGDAVVDEMMEALDATIMQKNREKSAMKKEDGEWEATIALGEGESLETTSAMEESSERTTMPKVEQATPEPPRPPRPPRPTSSSSPGASDAKVNEQPDAAEDSSLEATVPVSKESAIDATVVMGDATVAMGEGTVVMGEGTVVMEEADEAPLSEPERSSEADAAPVSSGDAEVESSTPSEKVVSVEPDAQGSGGGLRSVILALVVGVGLGGLGLSAYIATFGQGQDEGAVDASSPVLADSNPPDRSSEPPPAVRATAAPASGETATTASRAQPAEVGTPADRAEPAGSAAPADSAAVIASAAPEGAAAGEIRVKVVPPFAGVVVAGKRSSLQGGYLTLTGKTGDVIRIRVTVGGRSRIALVTLSAAGPKPAAIHFAALRARSTPGAAAAPAHDVY